jgi:hypothetical protein
MDADLLHERDGRDSGIENVIHRQKIRYTILRDRKTDQSVGDHSEAVCGDFRSVPTPLLEIIVMMDEVANENAQRH